MTKVHWISPLYLLAQAPEFKNTLKIKRSLYNSMNLEINTIYTQQMPSFRVPGMTQEQTIEWFRSGRICGIALECIIANQFENTSSDEATQGESPDLWVSIDGVLKSVQVKTTNRMDFKSNKTQKISDKTKIRVGKSSLFDSKGRRTAEEIKDISDKYFSLYDYFMIVEITDVSDWCYSFIMIPTSDLELIDAENVMYKSIFNENRAIIELPFKDKE